MLIAESGKRSGEPSLLAQTPDETIPLLMHLNLLARFRPAYDPSKLQPWVPARLLHIRCLSGIEYRDLCCSMCWRMNSLPSSGVAACRLRAITSAKIQAETILGFLLNWAEDFTAAIDLARMLA
jgi:hypothetical protein